MRIEEGQPEVIFAQCKRLGLELQLAEDELLHTPTAAR